MGYYLPLKFFYVGNDCAIPATRIVAIMPTTNFQARETVKAEKRNKTLINAAGRDKVESAIMLDQGSVVASPLKVKTLLKAIEKSESNRVRGRRSEAQTIEVVIPDGVEPDEDSLYSEVEFIDNEEDQYNLDEDESLEEYPDAD